MGHAAAGPCGSRAPCRDCGSGGVRGRGLGQNAEDFTRVVCLAQALQHVRLTQQARDAREGLEVVAAGVLGGEEEEDEIDRFIVQGFEINGFFETREKAVDAIELLELDVRDGDAAAEAGRAQAFTLKEGIEDFASRDWNTRQFARRRGELAQGLLLAVRGKCRND